MKQLSLHITIFLTFSLACCSSGNERDKKNNPTEIKKDACGLFRINTCINEYDLSGYTIKDTSTFFSEEDEEATKGKKICFKNNEFICLWLFNDTITEILIKSTAFKTKENIHVGQPFKDFFETVKNMDILIDNEWGITYYLKELNLVAGISNSGEDNISTDEINDLYKMKLSVKQENLHKMKIEYIRILNFSE
jgi:hypothetical protein